MARRSEEERGFSVLLEEVRSKVEGVAEGHGVLMRQIQQARASVEERIGYLEQAVTEGFAKTGDSLKQMNGRIEQFVARVDAHERAHTH